MEPSLARTNVVFVFQQIKLAARISVQTRLKIISGVQSKSMRFFVFDVRYVKAVVCVVAPLAGFLARSGSGGCWSAYALVVPAGPPALPASHQIPVRPGPGGQ